MIPREVMDDREKYADDLELDIGGIKVKLGDIRSYEAEQAENTRRFQTRSQQLEGEYGKLANQYNELRALYDDVAQRVQAGGGAPDTKQMIDLLVERLSGGKNPTVLDKPGDFFKPLVDRLSAIESVAGNLEKFKKDLRDELTGAFGFQVTKDMKRDYRAFTWPKDWNFQRVMEYANEHQVLEPGTRYPDFDAIHERITAPIRDKEERTKLETEAEERGYQKAQTELRQTGGTMVPGPGFGSFSGAASKSKFGGIEKIPDELILNDQDIWSQMGQ